MLVGSSLIASRISREVVQPPDPAWPYGPEGQEALYVLFCFLVLLGVIGFGVGSSCATVIDWWRGISIAPLHLEPVAFYTALMKAFCGLLGLAAPPGLAPHGSGVAAAAHRGPQCADRCRDHLGHRSGPAGVAAAPGNALVCPCLPLRRSPMPCWCSR